MHIPRLLCYYTKNRFLKRVGAKPVSGKHISLTEVSPEEWQLAD